MSSFITSGILDVSSILLMKNVKKKGKYGQILFFQSKAFNILLKNFYSCDSVVILFIKRGKTYDI